VSEVDNFAAAGNRGLSSFVCSQCESLTGRGAQEIRVRFVYEAYGESGPLLDQMRAYGLATKEARELVATLAKRARREGKGRPRTRINKDDMAGIEGTLASQRAYRHNGTRSDGRPCWRCSSGQSHCGREVAEHFLVSVYRKHRLLEPLLDHFVDYGLGTEGAKALLISFAERAKRPRRGVITSQFLDDQDYRICILVADQLGALNGDISRPGKACRLVLERLQRLGKAQGNRDERTLRRVWAKTYPKYWFVFDQVIANGRSGVLDGLHPIYPSL